MLQTTDRHETASEMLAATTAIRAKLGDVRCELQAGNGGHLIFVYAANGREIACGFGKTIAAAASWAVTDATNREIKDGWFNAPVASRQASEPSNVIAYVSSR